MVVFCILYYILSFCQSIPCIAKIIKTKSSGDYSLLNRLLQYLALLCWTVYLSGTINWSTEYYLAIIGYIDVVLLTIENILILKYRKGDAR